jgi:hypothetical protein
MSELKPLLCCPFCESDDVEDDYDAVLTTFTGTRENPTGWHEYQSGWVDCNACGAQGPYVRAKDEQIDRINDMTRDAWNRAPRAT